MAKKVLTEEGIPTLWARFKAKATEISTSLIEGKKGTELCPLGDDGKVPASNLPEGLPATIDALTSEEIEAMLADDAQQQS